MRMASTGLEDDLRQLSLVRTSYPAANGAENHPVKLSSTIFPSTEYSVEDKAAIEHWVKVSPQFLSSSEQNPEASDHLSALNTHLSDRTTLIGSKPSIADVVLYDRLAPTAKAWTDEQRTGEHGYPHVVRWLDFVENSPLFELKLPQDQKLNIDPSKVLFYPKPVDRKAEKERAKKEKAAANASTQSNGAPNEDAAAAGAVSGEKKERKQKQPKSTKPAAEKPLSPALIDLRVGHILKAINHPDADSLYVSTIACGDAPGSDNTTEYEGKVVRTVCSGLNGLVPLAEMQGRKVVVVCNLKPVKMRGIQSAAMVLAASPRLAAGEEDHHSGPVELVTPPEGAEAGDRVFFEGWEGEPEAQLNPKKKVWEMCQVGFTTTVGKEVAFDVSAVEQLKESGKAGVSLLKTRGGICTVKSLAGATVR